MTNKIWALPLALVGGAAIGVALTWRMRDQQRNLDKQQRKEDIRAWEGEGGSTAPRPAAV